MFEVAGRKEESVRRQAVARLRNALQGTANHIASQAQQENWQEAVGSPCAVDITAGGTRIGGGAWAGEVQTLARLRLVAIEDGLGAMARLIGEEGGIFAPWVVGRFVIEAAAQAWWLLEPGLPIRDRIARSLTDRVMSLRESLKVETDMGIENPVSTARLAHIRKEADELGLPFHNPPKSAWAVGDQHRPGRTDLVTQLLADNDLSAGSVVYRYLAGVAHGEGYALMQHMSGAQWHAPAGAMVQPTVTVNDVATLAGVTLIGASPALRRSVAYFGWDEDSLNQWLQHTLPSVFAYVETSAQSD